MGLSRGPLFWLLLGLLAAACSGILFVLYSSAAQPYGAPGARARPGNRKNIQVSPPEATEQVPHKGRRITIQGEEVHQVTAQGTGALRGAEARRAPAEQQSTGPQERGGSMLETLSPRKQERGTATNRTGARSLHSQDTRTTRGRRQQPKKPPAMRPIQVKPRGQARTTGSPQPAQGQKATILTTVVARSTMRRIKRSTAARVSPVKRAQASARNAPSQSSAVPRNQELRAANFKSQPEWDFEEQYSLDVGGLQSKCPDSVKAKASKSPWLQNLFLPNITLFLDSRRFNQSEWLRLEHFAPPFGFMELNYSLVRSVVAHFPAVPQQQLLLASLPAGSAKCISCAVVGNGGILNNSRMGREIDSHDYVFRLSGALLQGYEQDVGTRTSFYGFTAFSLTQSVISLGQRGFKHVPQDKDTRYLHFLEGTRDYEWLEGLLLNQPMRTKNLFWFRRRPLELFPPDLPLSRYLLLHPDLMRYMKNRFLRSKTLNTVHWRIYRPTTGALLLLTALQLCDQVSAYGFITEGHERFSDHYYDKNWKKTVFYLNHDFRLERETWKRLHDEGIIRLYQRPVTPKPKV
ncbi:alpha-N-acetylgalactosaminide alpha-2,6-sialyltransferase 1 isoform X1 [Erinaceus europaeus]|uniref:alpha-N-acetylgalactosaminide alpha-2,6-sialyltransferase n=1 Tax=Erinaceus europaeus TaxID=9365 RepID=A0ABM3YCK6_ERIEU|nr:alpha-N-acetylgalactosaminide alpha-2,6-sialyltransferase 1 isoform X1 [Erinaceus europaeus]